MAEVRMIRRAPVPTKENEGADRPPEPDPTPSPEPAGDEPFIRPVSRAQLMSAGRPVMTRPGW